MRMRLIAIAAVMLVGALAAVGAGAFDREPVAPQLSPEESGVKPGVVPGEVQTIQTPGGTVQAEISPCIKSDPSGYSAAELAHDDEWCFHEPGAGDAAAAAGGPAEARSDPNPKGKLYQFRDGRMEQVQPGG